MITAAGRSETTLFATADAFIRRDQPNRNEGANVLLRVGAGPLLRTLVQFNDAELTGQPGVDNSSKENQ